MASYCAFIFLLVLMTGSTSLAEISTTFVCPPVGSTPEHLFPNPESCTSFISCSNGIPYIMNCPGNLYYNPTLHACDYPENVKCELCKAATGSFKGFTCPYPNGLFPNPESCTSFIQCSNNYPYVMKCPDGLVFNPTLLVCDWPYNVPSCNCLH